MCSNIKYDYLIVGAGLFGAVCAYRLKQMNKKVLVIDKRYHIGGNIYTEKLLVVYLFINMGLIFSILIIRMFGIL